MAEGEAVLITGDRWAAGTAFKNALPFWETVLQLGGCQGGLPRSAVKPA